MLLEQSVHRLFNVNFRFFYLFYLIDLWKRQHRYLNTHAHTHSFGPAAKINKYNEMLQICSLISTNFNQALFSATPNPHGSFLGNFGHGGLVPISMVTRIVGRHGNWVSFTSMKWNILFLLGACIKKKKRSQVI